jgi:NitT/TauT family transport system permease protein
MAMSVTSSMSVSTAEASLNADGEDPVRTIERTGKSRNPLRNIVPPFLMFLVFLGIWYSYSALKFDVAARRINTLPYPHEVITDGFMPLWDESNGLRPAFGYLWVTLIGTLAGLAVSIVLGVLIAVVMNLAKSAERAIFPYAVVAQTVPILAILPLLTQVFGEKFMVRLVVIVLIAIFPVITNTLFGLQSADQLHHDLFTLNKASRWTRLWKLELPGAIPALMTGVRIASGGAVIGAVVADFFFTRGQKGIGYFIRVKQQRAAERPEMFMGTILASMFGVVMFLVIGYITNRAIRNWHDSARRRN